MAVTIKQIAELAGVSRGTVDRVLNKRPGIKEETKMKVLKISEELNYQPNFLGKALVQSKAPIKIGIILTPEYNPFIQEILEGIRMAENEFRAFGIEILIKMPISLEPAEQISILSELENEPVSGIAVFPIDNKRVCEKINSLSEKGVAIVTFNSRIDNTKDICFVGQNHYKGGRTAAGLMSKLLPQGGRVGIIISSYNLSCHKDRLHGFTDRLKELASPIQIVEVVENQDKKDEAFKLTLEMSNKYKELNGIYITGGGIAGVGSALSLSGKSNHICTICHDLVPDTVELLKNGTVDFALGQSPTLQGYQLVKILFDYLVKKQLPENSYTEIPITISTSDSI